MEKCWDQDEAVAEVLEATLLVTTAGKAGFKPEKHIKQRRFTTYKTLALVEILMPIAEKNCNGITSTKQ